jgi:hypothetical protein
MSLTARKTRIIFEWRSSACGVTLLLKVERGGKLRRPGLASPHLRGLEFGCWRVGKGEGEEKGEERKRRGGGKERKEGERGARGREKEEEEKEKRKEGKAKREQKGKRNKTNKTAKRKTGDPRLNQTRCPQQKQRPNPTCITPMPFATRFTGSGGRYSTRHSALLSVHL